VADDPWHYYGSGRDIGQPGRAAHHFSPVGGFPRHIADADPYVIRVATPVPPKTVTLPSVIGVPFADARRALRSLGFTDIRTVPRFSKEAPGTIVEQVPQPGASLPLDQLISLMVAKSPSAPSAQPVSGGLGLAGIWEEIPPFQRSGNPMRLNVQENGSEVTVRINDSGLTWRTLVNNGEATFTRPQSCGARFQHAGYNYDNPGSVTRTLRIDGSILSYIIEQRWTSPCDGHPIGVGTATYRFRRVSG
jgi:hypothetical protein